MEIGDFIMFYVIFFLIVEDRFCVETCRDIFYDLEAKNVIEKIFYIVRFSQKKKTYQRVTFITLKTFLLTFFY